MPKHILVVDDEPRIARLARDYLEHAGFTVSTASGGREALSLARTAKPDLVVLDLGLPDLDGLDVTRTLRSSGSAVPIIMLTARADETDKLVGLELGADDYIAKPFSPKELVARVRAVLRRTDRTETPARIDVRDVAIEAASMRVWRAGALVDLTPTEFQIVAAMAAQPGRIFTRAHLLDVVHGVAIESYERAIDAHVKNIRRKLEPDPKQPRYIETVHGVGYRFADDA